jgi:hypothetical protein
MQVQHYAVSLALADTAAKLRQEYPEIYAKVDVILAGPRGEHGASIPLDESQYEWIECKWCGDNFAARASLKQQCCSRKCSDPYKKWRNKRAKRGVL